MHFYELFFHQESVEISAEHRDDLDEPACTDALTLI